MKITPNPTIPDVILFEPKVYPDFRGYFLETRRSSFMTDALGHTIEFLQSNVNSSLPNVLRGLHYQIKNPQGKYVTCIQGSIWDVAVDLRRGSPTFMKSVGYLLSEENHHAVWVPPGFAHGTLSGPKGSKVMYECSSYYDERFAQRLAWNDPEINAAWPRPDGLQPVLSNDDRAGLPLSKLPVFEPGWDKKGPR